MAPGWGRRVWKALLMRSWVRVFTCLLIHCEEFSRVPPGPWGPCFCVRQRSGLEMLLLPASKASPSSLDVELTRLTQGWQRGVETLRRPRKRRQEKVYVGAGSREGRSPASASGSVGAETWKVSLIKGREDRDASTMVRAKLHRGRGRGV